MYVLNLHVNKLHIYVYAIISAQRHQPLHEPLSRQLILEILHRLVRKIFVQNQAVGQYLR